MSSLKHGDSMSDSQTYKIYKTYARMKYLCTNSSSQNWSCYGGRGVTICEQWVNSYEAFRDWSLSHNYAEGRFLIRRNKNGNYSPDNCMWSNSLAQNLIITAFGEAKLITDWVKDSRCVVNDSLLRARMRENKNPELSMSCRKLPKSERKISVRVKVNQYLAFGEYKSRAEWAKDSRCVVSYDVICRWIKKGYSMEEIITGQVYANKIKSDKTKTNRKQYLAFGEYKSRAEWSRDPRCVVSYDVLLDRLKRGDDVETSISNKRSKQYLAFGEYKSCVEWSHDSRCSMPYSVLYNFLRQGYNVEYIIAQRALENDLKEQIAKTKNKTRLLQRINERQLKREKYKLKPTKKHVDEFGAQLVQAFGECKTISEWFEDTRCVVYYDTLRSRIQRGINPEIAMSVR